MENPTENNRKPDNRAGCAVTEGSASGHSAENRCAPPLETESELVCEALVREIAYAQRWSAVVGAWNALLHVRRMSRQMLNELQRLNGGSSPNARDVPTSDTNGESLTRK